MSFPSSLLLLQALARGYLATYLIAILLLATFARGFASFGQFRFTFRAQLITALLFRGAESLLFRFPIAGAGAAGAAETFFHRRLDTGFHGGLLGTIFQGAFVVSEASFPSSLAFTSFFDAFIVLVLVVVVVVFIVLVLLRNAALLNASLYLLFVRRFEIVLALGIGVVMIALIAWNCTRMARKAGVNFHFQRLTIRLLVLIVVVLRTRWTTLLQASAILLEFRTAIGGGERGGNVAGDEQTQENDRFHVLRNR